MSHSVLVFRFWKIDFAFLIEIVRRVLCEWKRGIFAFEKMTERE